MPKIINILLSIKMDVVFWNINARIKLSIVDLSINFELIAFAKSQFS
jgi:hypothetical protein